MRHEPPGDWRIAASGATGAARALRERPAFPVYSLSLSLSRARARTLSLAHFPSPVPLPTVGLDRRQFEAALQFFKGEFSADFEYIDDLPTAARLYLLSPSRFLFDFLTNIPWSCVDFHKYWVSAAWALARPALAPSASLRPRS